VTRLADSNAPARFELSGLARGGNSFQPARVPAAILSSEMVPRLVPQLQPEQRSFSASRLVRSASTSARLVALLAGPGSRGESCRRSRLFRLRSHGTFFQRAHPQHSYNSLRTSKIAPEQNTEESDDHRPLQDVQAVPAPVEFQRRRLSAACCDPGLLTLVCTPPGVRSGAVPWKD